MFLATNDLNNYGNRSIRACVSFEFPVEPEELRNGLWLKIASGNAKASIRVEVTWEQKTYAHVLGGLRLRRTVRLLRLHTAYSGICKLHS